jgi:hypothetical protein
VQAGVCQVDRASLCKRSKAAMVSDFESRIDCVCLTISLYVWSRRRSVFSTCSC